MESDHFCFHCCQEGADRQVHRAKFAAISCNHSLHLGRGMFSSRLLRALSLYLCIFIYNYIYAVKLLSGPSLGVSGVIIWSKVGSLSGPILFFNLFYSGFKRFLKHSVIILCFLCPIILEFSENSLFEKKGAQIGFFNFLCFKFKILKFSFLGLLKHYKNRGFVKCLSFCC